MGRAPRCYNGCETDTSMAEKMRIHDNGNVGVGGIGSSLAPAYMFEITSDAVSSLFKITGDNDLGADFFSIESGTSYASFHAGSGNRAMVIRHSTRRIGVGTITDPACPLHIGTGVNHSGGGTRYFGNSTSSLAFDSNTTDAVSVRASSSILTEAFFLASSDSRIKCDIEDINDTEALELINRIEPKKYNYISRRQDNKTIGFIAQQVEEVIPNAVITQSSYVPDIMIQLDNPVWEDNKLIYDISFNENDTGKVKFYVEENEIEEEKDLEYNNGGFVFEKQYNRVFIYGKEVNDFKTVSKDKIFAVNVSATQELSKKVNLLETENNSLLERTQILEDKNTELENSLEILKTQLQELTSRVAYNELALKGLVN